MIHHHTKTSAVYILKTKKLIKTVRMIRINMLTVDFYKSKTCVGGKEIS